MKKKKIMILGASILQLPAIEKALEMGLEVIAVDMNPEAVGFKVPGVIKEVISTIDTPAILEAAKRHQINGVMTLASDMPMQSVAVASHEMGLVGISEDTALKATNKAFMRDALKEAGVPVPLYFRVIGKDEFKEAVGIVRAAGYKCIVKPADNSGSRGVDLLKEDADLDAAYNYTVQYSRGGEIVVEEFMEGPEVSVETLAVDGDIHVIQITDKLTTGAPYFVEMGHSQPSQLSEDVKERIREVAIAANEAIGIQNGPSHTEIKVTKDGPKIVELGARLGGDCITTHLVPLSTGVNMVECSIRIALGEKPDLEPKWSKGSAIRYLKTGMGIVKEIKGVDEAEKIEGVVQISIVHGIGEQVGEIKSSVDRAGFVIAQAENAQKAVEVAEKGIRQITIGVCRMGKKKYVFLSNSNKPSEEEQYSRKPVPLTNVSRPCLKKALDMGYEVWFGTNRDNPADLSCELPVHMYDSHTYRSIFNFKDNYIAYKNLMQVLNGGNFEVIHCNTPIGGVIGRLCGKKAHIDKVIYTAHGFHFYKGAPLINRTFLKWAEMIMAHWTDAIITMNREDYEAAKKFHLRNNGNVYYIPGVGINTEEYIEYTVDKYELRHKLGLSTDDCICISMGDLIPRKNYKTAIEAIAKCGIKNVHYLICGEGPEMDNLKQFASECKASDRIHFLGFRTDIKALLKISDIFLFSTLQEGMPRSMMEAMAAGLPCIASSIRGNVDLLEDGKGGYLIDPYNIKGYSEKIQILAKNPGKRLEMSDNNLKRIKSFDVKEVERIISDIYRNELKN